MSAPRHELKYVIPRDRADEFLERVSGVLAPDPHGGREGYRVCSLYFDTADHHAYTEKLDGVDPRAKVRLRTYDPGADRPRFFLEVKRRRNILVLKDRLRLDADDVDGVLGGGALTLTGDLADRAPAPLLTELGRAPLFPVVVVGYRRQALVWPEVPRVRVTVDEATRASTPETFPSPGLDDGRSFLREPLVVLELKFDHAIPLFLHDAARACGLLERRFSKYASALEALWPSGTERGPRVSALPRPGPGPR